VVFQLDTAGNETVLHSFTGGTTDGAYPLAGLILDSNGTLYGTAEGGGSSDHGVVFKLDSSGTLTVLHSFAGGKKDGCYPAGGLLQDKSGNLYGTTEACGSSLYGTVFKLDATGKETVLHNFAGGATDGAYPFLTSLLMDKQGSLYGVAEQGGPSDEGVVYKLNQQGRWTLLHSFGGGTTDGCYAVGAPAMDESGSLYGPASLCGSDDRGVMWKLSNGGRETLLHSFAGGLSDGAWPYAGVIMDGAGNFYGDTKQGSSTDCGGYGCGTVYKMTKKGTLTVLHSFVGSDGELPVGSLTRDSDGNLYGTTVIGGSSHNCDGGCGTVWKLTP
jgi:uncharacterized repeat protein (TIGR03803 family)